MTNPAPTLASRPGKQKLVRLEADRAAQLDDIANSESRTHVAQLGLIFDAGVRALGYAPDTDGET